MRADSLSLTEEVRQLSTCTSTGVFPLEYVCERDPVLSASSEMDPEIPWLKRRRISLQRLKCRLIFNITRWKDVRITNRDPRESTSTPPPLDKGPHITLTTQEAHRFQCFKVDDAWLFLNSVRNPNITVPTRNWTSFSRFTSRSIRIVLPSVLYIPEVFIVTRQESWRRWTNTSFEWPSTP